MLCISISLLNLSLNLYFLYQDLKTLDGQIIIRSQSHIYAIMFLVIFYEFKAIFIKLVIINYLHLAYVFSFLSKQSYSFCIYLNFLLISGKKSYQLQIIYIIMFFQINIFIITASQYYITSKNTCQFSIQKIVIVIILRESIIQNYFNFFFFCQMLILLKNVFSIYSQ
ncbi:hypothetical protein IMG5_125810 [Ichthyophthirius multifiliis]|uniref:Transmembrane protein n=1 Tax=Ichthyophthirius multifiliis TaxID=5932 RepID=G0QVS3_ICHMU|nr:hypothetical protein IMG5_125810 [Ichthyophthirius multifiliis]EGR30690.1 hypothetical protein IMG5_125810 [Ichthyophthirius multifiliis]|eukprot:XP_004032277.1 hypothetical protein IMG5_125810 [Ichthyophthirius multifiliis]